MAEQSTYRSTKALVSAVDHLARLTRENEALRKALARIASPHDCGCVPCTGQCRCEDALQICIEDLRDTAALALKESGQ